MSKKIRIKNNMYTVITKEEYYSSKDFYDTMIGTIAIQEGDYVYPLVRRSNEYGYHPGPVIDTFYVPEEEQDLFHKNNITDYTKAENIKQYIEMVNKFSQEEYQVLTSPDNIDIPRISRDDEPVMKILKGAVIKKRIDLDKYQERIGSTYQNDKRLFKGKSITLPKFINIANALDLKVTMTVEDKAPNVANPMGEKIVMELTGGSEDE